MKLGQAGLEAPLPAGAGLPGDQQLGATAWLQPDKILRHRFKGFGFQGFGFRV